MIRTAKEIAAELESKSRERGLLGYKVYARRTDFNKRREHLLVQMYKAGVPYCCAVTGCEAKNLSVDHIVPILHGGVNEVSNLQLLCKSHNSKKNTEPMRDLKGPTVAAKWEEKRAHRVRDWLAIERGIKRGIKKRW